MVNLVVQLVGRCISRRAVTSVVADTGFGTDAEAVILALRRVVDTILQLLQPTLILLGCSALCAALFVGVLELSYCGQGPELWWMMPGMCAHGTDALRTRTMLPSALRWCTARTGNTET